MDQSRGYVVDIGVPKEVKIGAVMVKKLLEWNVKANCNIFDVRFVRSLTVICIGLKNLKLRQFHQNTIEFIRRE